MCKSYVYTSRSQSRGNVCTWAASSTDQTRPLAASLPTAVWLRERPIRKACLLCHPGPQGRVFSMTEYIFFPKLWSYKISILLCWPKPPEQIRKKVDRPQSKILEAANHLQLRVAWRWDILSVLEKEIDCISISSRPTPPPLSMWVKWERKQILKTL